MKSLLRDWGRSVGWYLAIIVVGLVAILTASSAVGYLPYSDRPGPGWTQPSFSVGLLGFYLSWAAFLAIPLAIYGSVLFAFQRLIRYLGAPLLLVRFVGGALGGGLSLYAAAGAGWYIAIAAFPVWAAGALGVVWGVAVLPRYVGEGRPERLSVSRWAAIGAVIVGGAGALYLGFLMPRRGQVLELNVVRTAASADPDARGWERNLQPTEEALLDSLGLNGRLELVRSHHSISGDRSDTARALIVFTETLQTDARLALPEGASVVYVQRGDEWDMFPVDAPVSRRRVRLEVGNAPDEVLFSWPGEDPSVIRLPDDR